MNANPNDEAELLPDTSRVPAAQPTSTKASKKKKKKDAPKWQQTRTTIYGQRQIGWEGGILLKQ